MRSGTHDCCPVFRHDWRFLTLNVLFRIHTPCASGYGFTLILRGATVSVCRRCDNHIPLSHRLESGRSRGPCSIFTLHHKGWDGPTESEKNPSNHNLLFCEHGKLFYVGSLSGYCCLMWTPDSCYGTPSPSLPIT
jgi:hypothetical protein